MNGGHEDCNKDDQSLWEMKMWGVCVCVYADADTHTYPVPDLV